MLSLLVIIFAPALLLFTKGRTLIHFVKDVITGKKTWVGYSQPNNTSLPTIKDGVFTTDYQLKEPNEQFAENLDLLYAKNYNIGMDLITVLRQ